MTEQIPRNAQPFVAQSDGSARAAIRAVVFDLDGLMFNTEDVFHLAGTELLRRRNLEMTRDLMSAMLGRRPQESFATLKRMIALDETVEELLAESRDIFFGLLDAHLAPMPGLFDLLDAIQTLGLPTGVATSSPRFYLEDLLGRFGLLERFPLRLAAEDVSQGKPHPEIYQKAASLLGVPPGEMLVLEDSEAGTKSAVAAGAVVVSVPHVHTAHHDFTGARHIASGLADPAIQLILTPRDPRRP